MKKLTNLELTTGIMTDKVFLALELADNLYPNIRRLKLADMYFHMFLNFVQCCSIRHFTRFMSQFANLTHLHMIGGCQLTVDLTGLAERSSTIATVGRTLLRKLESLNLYDLTWNDNTKQIFDKILMHSGKSIVELSSPVHAGFYLPHRLPALQKLYQAIDEPIETEMPELQYICFSHGDATNLRDYNESIANVIAMCPKLEVMVFTLWDYTVARTVDQELRRFQRNNVSIFAVYNSGDQERAGPTGWKTLNDHWQWKRKNLTEFQSDYEAIYWNVMWKASLWPSDLNWYQDN